MKRDSRFAPNGEEYERFPTLADLEEGVREMGWDTLTEFVKDTRLHLPVEFLVGKWIFVYGYNFLSVYNESLTQELFDTGTGWFLHGLGTVATDVSMN